jgi:hypothetical protein
MTGCSLEAVFEILGMDESKREKVEEMVNIPDALGRLPIHYACKHLHLKEAIEKLAIIRPESLRVADVSGFCRFTWPVALATRLL